jgi:hypothetical protein
LNTATPAINTAVGQIAPASNNPFDWRNLL